jgi:hypothetical protein
MDSVERKKIIFWMVLLLPLVGWFGTAKKLDMIRKGHVFGDIATAFGNTPSEPALIIAPLAGLAFAIFIGWLLGKLDSSEFAGARFSKHLRGTQMVALDKLIAKTTEKDKKQITIAECPVPTGVENQHIMIGGSTGTGKSQAIAEVMWKGMLRGDRFATLDPDGSLMARFFKPGDKILNPYDERTEGWSFFNEIRADYDYTRFANSVITRSDSNEGEAFCQYGRLIFADVARQLARDSNPTMSELHRWATVVEPERLQSYLKGSPAEALFVKGADKALGGARFSLSDKLAPHLNMPAGDFSIREWLDDPKGGNLWITWREDMNLSLRPLISAWTDTLCSSILSMNPDPNRRLWMVLDELASLSELPSLMDALTKGRKFGLRVIAGLQSTAQLDVIYGRDRAQALRACFRSLAVLGGGMTDADTAEYLSRALGEHEVEREQKTRSGGRNGGTNIAVRHEKERVVLPSEILSLPDLSGYLAFAGDFPIARFTLPFRKFKQQVPGFLPKGL